MQNELTFFTNEPSSALLDRFKRALRDVKFFDILVGYFHTSGFDKLHESFATIHDQFPDKNIWEVLFEGD
jgi:hypothetical protein